MMNLTSKSRYAIKIMMDLAQHGEQPHVQRHDIAARQGIPSDYLDQIMVRLRRARLVESVRGRGGGYRLARPAEAISLWDLFNAVEDSVYPVECLDEVERCDFEHVCVSKSVWGQIFAAMRAPLVELTLAKIVSAPRHDTHGLAGAFAAPAIQECKPGRHLGRQSDGSKDLAAGQGGS